MMPCTIDTAKREKSKLSKHVWVDISLAEGELKFGDEHTLDRVWSDCS